MTRRRAQSRCRTWHRTCFPCISGSAPNPTPECCGAAEKVRSSQPECLCVLIVESTSTSSSLPVNTTLALHLPVACHSSAKVSDCLSILKLSPDSPDAKIFKAAGTDLPSTSPATSSSISGSSNLSASGGSSSTAASKSGGAISAGSLHGAAASLLMASIAMLIL